MLSDLLKGHNYHSQSSVNGGGGCVGNKPAAINSDTEISDVTSAIFSKETQCF
jgi:hypothetical protein